MIKASLISMSGFASREGLVPRAAPLQLWGRLWHCVPNPQRPARQSAASEHDGSAAATQFKPVSLNLNKAILLDERFCRGTS